jgi:hypothetical protein
MEIKIYDNYLFIKWKKMKNKIMMILFLLIISVNDLWCQNFQDWRIEIDTPKWIHGTWEDVDCSQFRIIFEPEHITFNDRDRSTVRLLENNDLPEFLSKIFLVGTYYAIVISSAYIIYADLNEPIGVSIIGLNLPPDGKYLRKVTIAQNTIDGEWYYGISFLRKIE